MGREGAGGWGSGIRNQGAAGEKGQRTRDKGQGAGTSGQWPVPILKPAELPNRSDAGTSKLELATGGGKRIAGGGPFDCAPFARLRAGPSALRSGWWKLETGSWKLEATQS